MLFLSSGNSPTHKGIERKMKAKMGIPRSISSLFQLANSATCFVVTSNWGFGGQGTVPKRCELI